MPEGSVRTAASIPIGGVAVTGPVLYLHDGSFEGLLTAVFQAMATGLPVLGMEPERDSEPGLFEDVRNVEPNREQAARVWRSVRDRCGSDVASMAHAAFLSEIPGIGTRLYHHLSRILSGQDLSGGRDILDPHSLAVLQAAQKTRHEAHRFEGFVRFSEAPDGTMFSVIEPEHDIVALLVPHFRARFPGVRWMIADAKRGKCAHCDGSATDVSRIDPTLLPRDAHQAARFAAPADARWQELWRTFFGAVNIRERRNPRQQDRVLPRKYRQHLPEMA